MEILSAKIFSTDILFMEKLMKIILQVFFTQNCEVSLNFLGLSLISRLQIFFIIGTPQLFINLCDNNRSYDKSQDIRHGKRP